MFGFRRISFRPSPCCPSSLFTLILGLHYNVAAVSGYNALPYLNHGYLRQLLVSSYSSYSVEPLKVAKGKPSRFAPSFSTLAEPILVQAHDPSRLALDLVNAVDEHRFEDAWKLCERHMLMYGFLRKSTLTKLISGSAESCQSQWLAKAYDLVELIFNEKKHELLEKESLIYLSFILARCESPILSSNVLRKLIQMEAFPPLSAWSGIIGHMSQTATGVFLAAELIMEIGYLFNDNRVDPRKKSNRPLLVMKPNSNVFNIALTGCLLFGTTRKAERLLDSMPRIGVKADANLLIIMAHVYEKNGRKDEIKKLKRHIEEACDLTSSQFQQFYNCLLSCHLKFGDLASATEIVLGMLRKAKEAKMSLSAAKSVVAAVDTRKASVTGVNYELKKLDVIEIFSLAKSQAPSYNEFLRDRKYSRLETEAQECLHLLTDMLQGQVELVKMENGILHPTDKIYAKLVRAFLEADKVSDLAAFLITASKEDSPSSIENSAVVQVINACISLGMLDQAHDLLDEMRFSGVRLGSSIYSSLLKAYCKENRQGDAMALLRDGRKAGVQLDSSCYEALIESRIHHKDSSGALHLFKEMKESNIPRSGNHGFEMLVEGCSGSGEANLMAKLLEEIKDNRSMNYGVHDWNSIIHFFCKKRLMHDAQRALNKMRALGHSPNAVTFHSLVTGYAAIGGKYTEVTDLWGEMKVLASSSSMKFDQELLDSLLYCFVRGGFFLRAMEVIEMMEKGNMFIDKYKYRSLWLKYHRTLYKGKAPKVQTEAQCKRREAALTFKKWIGLT